VLKQYFFSFKSGGKAAKSGCGNNPVTGYNYQQGFLPTALPTALVPSPVNSPCKTAVGYCFAKGYFNKLSPDAFLKVGSAGGKGELKLCSVTGKILF
jgi:hypothetical protein